MNSAVASSSEPPSSICNVCQGFGDMTRPRGFIKPNKTDDPERRYVYTYMHQPNLGTLYSSAEGGCRLCAVFVFHLNKRQSSSIAHILARSSTQLNITPSDADEDEAERFAEIVKGDEECAPVEWQTYDNGRIVLELKCDTISGPRGCRNGHKFFISVCLRGTQLWTHLPAFINIGDPVDAEAVHRPSRNLLADPHINLINRWRKTCETEHNSCPDTTCSQQLPSRVLELLDPTDTSNGWQVRLIETHHIMQGRYACLSYCWGKSRTQTGQTLSGNLQRQLQGIPLHDLPDTVVDAIFLCKKLGFRFLWVDRLCIVQDDTDDWKAEASKMCDIYSRSALTISVLICNESSQSFLEKRNSVNPFGEEKGEAILGFRTEDSGLKGSIYFGPRMDQLALQCPRFLEGSWAGQSRTHSRPEIDWLCRGWTLQEWMLSPRVIHMHSITLWDCFNGYANEITHRYMARPLLIRDPEQLEMVPWRYIVQEYSERSVRYSKDRLPALAGLAARFRRRTGYTYLAGLWREELPLSLLWHSWPIGNSKRAIEHADQSKSIPSWSWAAVDRATYLELALRDTTVTTATLVSDWRQHEHSDSFIEVENAWIEVEGQISAVTHLDTGMPPGFASYRLKAGEDSDWWQSHPDGRDNYPDEEVARGDLYLLCIASDGLLHWALILQKVIGSENVRECFRRLGLSHLSQGVHKCQSSVPKFQPTWESRVVHII